MARKAGATPKPGADGEAAAEAGAGTADDELKVLFPDVEIEVRDPDTGEPVVLTVREFRFREGLEAAALARPLIAALEALVPEDAETALPDPAALDAALGAHADLWLELVARACGRDAAWLARLGDGDAHAVTLAMWGANGGFFCAPRRGRRRGAGGDGAPVPLSRVLGDLAAAGHGRGHAGLCETLTWRQMELFWRRAGERRAEELEALAAGLGVRLSG